MALSDAMELSKALDEALALTNQIKATELELEKLRIDRASLFNDLHEYGQSYSEIARHVGMDPKRVTELITSLDRRRRRYATQDPGLIAIHAYLREVQAERGGK